VAEIPNKAAAKRAKPEPEAWRPQAPEVAQSVAVAMAVAGAAVGLAAAAAVRVVDAPLGLRVGARRPRVANSCRKRSYSSTARPKSSRADAGSVSAPWSSWATNAAESALAWARAERSPTPSARGAKLPRPAWSRLPLGSHHSARSDLALLLARTSCCGRLLRELASSPARRCGRSSNRSASRTF